MGEDWQSRGISDPNVKRSKKYWDMWYEYEDLLNEWRKTDNTEEKKQICATCRKFVQGHVLNKYGLDIMTTPLCETCANNNMIPE